MNTYCVKIQATIRKSIDVWASGETDAVEQAHKQFTVNIDGNYEYYEQDTVSVKTIKDKHYEIRKSK